MLCYSILYHITQYHIISYDIILYHIIRYCIISYYIRGGWLVRPVAGHGGRREEGEGRSGGTARPTKHRREIQSSRATPVFQPTCYACRSCCLCLYLRRTPVLDKDNWFPLTSPRLSARARAVTKSRHCWTGKGSSLGGPSADVARLAGSCIHTDIHTDIHTYLPTYIHAYIRTYVRTYIRTYNGS